MADEKYITTSAYKAVNSDEIGYEKGVVVTVLEKKLDGWWRVAYQGTEGWTPGSFLKRLEVQEYQPSGILGAVETERAAPKSKDKDKPKKNSSPQAAAEGAAVVKTRIKDPNSTMPPPRRVR